MGASFAAPGVPRLDADHAASPDAPRISDDGTVDLVWSLDTDDPATFELEQSGGPDAREPHVRYRGGDRESVITGLREGDYRFRIRAIDAAGDAGAWSEPLELRVRYLGRGWLFLLLGTGATVAALTVGTIVHGFLRNR